MLSPFCRSFHKQLLSKLLSLAFFFNFKAHVPRSWVVNLKKSELEPKQIFNFVGYQYDLIQGVVRPTPERWEALNSKINSLLERTSCSVRQLMSLIGLLMAMVKQVPSGRLHMRPIQWHLKSHWHILESLEKVIPIPRSLHPQRRARPKLALSSSRGSDFHRRIKRRLGCTFRRLYRQGWLVCAGKKIAYQFPRIEGGFIGTKGLRTSLPGLGSFSCHQQQHCGSLHKQRRRHAFRLCMCSPLETPVLVQSQGNLPESTSHSGPAQCDSRQTVQTPSSHSDGVISSPGCLCTDLPQMPSSQGGPVAMRYNCKLPQFVSPVPNPKAWAMDASTLSWEDLDLYAFPPVPLLTNVLTKALSHRCKRMIIVARGWPNMPWFWDLVEMSSQIPVCLPNQPDLLSQPFNGNLQRDLQNLNLHAWLLEPKISGNKGSLTKW